MAFEIYEEIVVPRLLAVRTRLYAREIDVGAFERYEDFAQRARAVAQRNDDARLVFDAFGARRGFPADDEKTRLVVLFVLYSALENRDVVGFGGYGGGYRADLRIFGRHLDSGGGAVNGFQQRVGQVPVKPRAALAYCLVFGAYLAHAVELPAREQAVLYFEIHLAHDE